MMTRTHATVHRGRIRGAAIGASIKVSVCEALGIQHDAPGVKLRGFSFVRDRKGNDEKPDVWFDLIVRSEPPRLLAP